MTELWKCPSCGHEFPPSTPAVDVQCTHCGVWVDEAAARSTNTRNKTPEAPPTAPSAPQSYDHLPSEHAEEALDALEASFLRDPESLSSKEAAVVIPSTSAEENAAPSLHDSITNERPEPSQSMQSLLSPEMSLTQNLWRNFGPTILACALFLAWIVYDKLIR